MSGLCCNNRKDIKSWLSTQTKCDTHQNIQKLFVQRLFLGKIVYCIFDFLKQNLTFNLWLNKILLKNIDLINIYTVDSFVILNRISLQTNIIIKVFRLIPSNFETPACDRTDHISSCSTIVPYFVSSLVSLSSKPKKQLVFVVDTTNKSVVYKVNELELDDFRIHETDFKTVLDESLFTDYLQKKYVLPEPPVINFTHQVNANINVHLYIAYSFVTKLNINVSNQLEYIGSWGDANNPDLSVIILSGHTNRKRYLILENKEPFLKTTVPRYMHHIKNGDYIQKKYPKSPVHDDDCPCSSLPPQSRNPMKRLIKPVGDGEQDFTHVLKMFALFDFREQQLVLACSRLSIICFDIER
jgi:hypothetical protein